jgi:hypothetical protein
MFQRQILIYLDTPLPLPAAPMLPLLPPCAAAAAPLSLPAVPLPLLLLPLPLRRCAAVCCATAADAPMRPARPLCENILRGYLYVFDLAFSHHDGIHGFKFPSRFLGISCRDLTSLLLN